MQTRVFQSGNSIAVRIPKELAIVSPSQDVEIEQVGDSLVIRPIRRKKLAGLGTVLAGFSPEFMADGRDVHDEPDRDWELSVQEPSAPGRYGRQP